MEQDEDLEDERETMKKYFMKSAVYKRFKNEEDKELAVQD